MGYSNNRSNSSSNRSKKSNITTVKDFDPRKFTCSEVKDNGYGSNQVYLNYDNGKLSLQLPRMEPTIPKIIDKKTGNAVYTVFLRPSPESELYKKLADFDVYMKELAMKNWEEWFPDSKKSEDVLTEKYKPTIVPGKVDKKDKTKRYRNSIKLKLYPNTKFLEENEDGENELMTFDSTEDLYEFLESKPDGLKCIANCNKIYFMDGKFGATWSLNRAIVYPREDDTCFLEESDKEIEEVETIEEEEEGDYEYIEVSTEPEPEATEPEKPKKTRKSKK